MREQKFILLGFIVLPLLIMLMSSWFFQPIFTNQIVIGYQDDAVIEDVDNASWVYVDDYVRAMQEGRIDLFVSKDNGLVIRSSQPQYAVYRMILGIPKVEEYLGQRSVEYLTPYFESKEQAIEAYQEANPAFTFEVNYHWVSSETPNEAISQEVLFNGTYSLVIAMLFAFFLVYQRKQLMVSSLFGNHPILLRKHHYYRMLQIGFDCLLLILYSLLLSAVLVTFTNAGSIILLSLLVYSIFYVLDNFVESTTGFSYLGSILMVITLMLSSTFVPNGQNFSLIEALLNGWRFGTSSGSISYWFLGFVALNSIIIGGKYVIRSKRVI